MIFTGLSAWATSALGAGWSLLGLSPVASSMVMRIGASILWAGVSRALAPKVPTQQVQATLNESAGPRVRAYGLVALGGTRALWEAKDDILHQIVAMHHGPVSRILGFRVDDVVVSPLPDGSVVEGEWGTNDGFAGILGGSESVLNLRAIKEGDGGDYADARAAFPTIWTANHKLTGLATYYAQMKNPGLESISRVFPNAAHTKIAGIVEASPVYDPRTGTTAYSTNAALCIRDYLTHPDGYRIPPTKIDDADFSWAADVCGEIWVRGDGLAEPRYQTCGHYSLDDEPKNTLARMESACDMRVYLTPEGKVGILGGKYSAPDVTITERDILGYNLCGGYNPFEDFNVLRGKFISPDHDFQETECAEWRDTEALAMQAERVEELTVDMCPSYAQLRRLMKSHRMRARAEWVGTIRTNLVGLKARFPKGDGIHTVRFHIPEMGIDGVFAVESHRYDVVGGWCEMEVRSVWDAWAWTATEEGEKPKPLADVEKNLRHVNPPTGTVAQDVIDLDAGAKASRMVYTATDPGRIDLQLEAQYRVKGTTDWKPMTAAIRSLKAYSDAVNDNAVYEARARWRGRSGWSAVVEITTLSNPVAPAAPTNFTAVLNGDNTVTATWKNPADNFFRARLFRAQSANFGDAVAVTTVDGIAGASQSVTVDIPIIGTGWRYWVQALNASLVASSPAGPITPT